MGSNRVGNVSPTASGGVAVKLLVPALAALAVATAAYWRLAERPVAETSSVAPARAGLVSRASPSIPVAQVAAPVAAPTAPASPPRQLRRPPSVQIIRVAQPQQFDAPGTGGPYFTHELRRWIRQAGIPTEKIRMTVTRSHLILNGSVNSEAARARVDAVVESRTPRQLTVDNRLKVTFPRTPWSATERRRDHLHR